MVLDPHLSGLREERLCSEGFCEEEPQKGLEGFVHVFDVLHHIGSHRIICRYCPCLPDMTAPIREGCIRIGWILGFALYTCRQLMDAAQFRCLNRVRTCRQNPAALHGSSEVRQ